MKNSHRTRRLTPADFNKPWSLKIFRHRKVVYVKCETCRVFSKRGLYNRAAYKRGEDYFFTIRRVLP
jgi:hypothetical protein